MVYQNGPTIRYVRPWHGVFVYGPRPSYHRHYVAPRVGAAAAPAPVVQQHLPKRRIDRDDSFALGVRMGSYISGYEGGSVYGDLGLGITARYRPEEAIGLELAVTHFNQTFDGSSERAQTVGQASAMLFAAPWSRISPYALVGLTGNKRSIGDDFMQEGRVISFDANDFTWGPHVGVGVEVAVGKRFALDLEARYAGFIGFDGQDPSSRGALTTNAGVVWHF